MAPVIFKVRCDRTQPGESVFVVGSHDVIGSWAPGKALLMKTSAHEFPVWSLEAQVPTSGPVEYKFIIQKEDRSGQATWEECGNHVVRPEEGEKLMATSAWGASDVQLMTAGPRKAADSPELEVLWESEGSADFLEGPSAVFHAFHWPFREVQKWSEKIAEGGFDAVQLSPAQRSIPGNEWWTRYQPVRYEDIHGLGSEDDLRAACEACKKVGMQVMGDLVFNHMKVVAGCDEWRRAQHDHGHLEHLKRRLSENLGPTFNRNDFQWPWFPLEGEEWDGPNRMEGWGCGEWSELKGGSEKVVAVHAAHVEKLKSCGVSGFRFDAAKHMRPEHIKTYVSRAGTYAFGEVLSVDPSMQKEYTAGCATNGSPFPTTDFLLACWLRRFLENGEDGVDFHFEAWVKHLLDVEFGKGNSPPPCAGAAKKGCLRAPLLASNSVRFARNHDTVCNDVPFYGLGKWGLEGAQVATAWLLASHDGTVMLLAEDVTNSPLIRQALLYRKRLREKLQCLTKEDRKAVKTIIRVRRAHGGGIPLTVCLACKGPEGLIGFCVLNPHPASSAEFAASSCLAGSAGKCVAASGSGEVLLTSDGKLQEAISLGPRDGAFFLVS